MLDRLELLIAPHFGAVERTDSRAIDLDVQSPPPEQEASGAEDRVRTFAIAIASAPPASRFALYRRTVTGVLNAL